MFRTWGPRRSACAVATLTSRKDAASHARAAEAAREISDLCLSLHQALVHDRISRMDI